MSNDLTLVLEGGHPPAETKIAPMTRALECDQFGRTCDLISQGCD